MGSGEWSGPSYHGKDYGPPDPGRGPAIGEIESRPRADLTHPRKTMLETHPELKTAEGGAWSTPELIARGIPPVDLARRRRRFQLVYWRDRLGGYHYPKWQFDRSLHVRPEVTEILSLFRTHDTMRVLSWFVQPVTPGRKSLLDLIRAGRGERAIALVRQEEQRNAALPPLSKKSLAELKRRMRDFDDPTRYVIAHGLTRKHASFYELERDVYFMNEITPGCLFRRREHAEAVARSLDRGKRGSRFRHGVVAVRKTRRGVRVLESLADPFDPKKRVKPRLRGAGPAKPPRFVPIAPAHTRAHIVDALVFALEHPTALLGLIAQARSRTAARRRLIHACGLSTVQADAVLELRYGQFTQAAARNFAREWRTLLRRESSAVPSAASRP